MNEKYLLLAGRVGAGKSEMMIAYANQYPETTLILSEESNKIELNQCGLNPEVAVIEMKQFKTVNLAEYETVCIEYIELFDQDELHTILQTLKSMDKRIIAITQMRRTSFAINNVFERSYRHN